jgi:hypothetical protein
MAAAWLPSSRRIMVTGEKLSIQAWFSIVPQKLCHQL